MNKKISIALFACAVVLCSCGGDSKKVDGGYFGDVPSLLISQAEDKEEFKHRAKTEMESEDDFVKLQSEANKKEEEYETKLEKAYEGLKAISVRYAMENADYEMETPPTMDVRRFSSESAGVTVKFTLKAKNDVPTTQLNDFTKEYSHAVYCKFIDKDGNVVCKKNWYIGKLGDKALGASIAIGTSLPCEVSFNFSADKEEIDGKTVFTVPEAAIDKMVVITKDEYDTLENGK